MKRQVQHRPDGLRIIYRDGSYLHHTRCGRWLPSGSLARSVRSTTCIQCRYQLRKTKGQGAPAK